MAKSFEINSNNQQNKTEVSISFLKELADLFEKHKVSCIGLNTIRGAWGSETEYVNICFTDWAVPDIDLYPGTCTEEIKSQLEELKAPGNQGS
jgi:hypothetical protein